VDTQNLSPVPEGYEFSDDSARMDRERVTTWLSTEAYWSLDRPKKVQEAAMDGSRNFGIFRIGTGEQVAYARLVTDGATFGWLCDVFVDPRARGEGLGTALIANVSVILDELGLKQIVLATTDAQGLYAKFGFEHSDSFGRWMTRRKNAQ
jgi:N-acetylglutamate synthase-like GNAT family acetyltransferase